MIHTKAVCPVVLCVFYRLLPERDLFAAVARVHAWDAGSLASTSRFLNDDGTNLV
jgi:hypothetical protein